MNNLRQQCNKKKTILLKTIETTLTELRLKVKLLDSGREVEVTRPAHYDNPFGFASQMWLFDDQGNPYHEDEVEFIKILN